MKFGNCQGIHYQRKQQCSKNVALIASPSPFATNDVNGLDTQRTNDCKFQSYCKSYSMDHFQFPICETTVYIEE